MEAIIFFHSLVFVIHGAESDHLTAVVVVAAAAVATAAMYGMSV